MTTHLMNYSFVFMFCFGLSTVLTAGLITRFSMYLLRVQTDDIDNRPNWD